MTYDIYNPTPSRRVIYDGIENKKAIEIMPGQIVKNIELADHVVEKLRGKVNGNAFNELQLTESKTDTSGPVFTGNPMKIKDDGVTIIRAGDQPKVTEEQKEPPPGKDGSGTTRIVEPEVVVQKHAPSQPGKR